MSVIPSDSARLADANKTRRPRPNLAVRGGITPGWTPVAGLLCLAILAFAAITPFDRFIYDHFTYKRTEIEDWHRLFRIAGYIPTWLLVAAVLYIQLGRRARIGLWHPAKILFIPILAAAALSEVLKVISKRHRPEVGEGAYTWRPWADDFLSTSGIGLPSGHAATAFAAAFILTRLYPKSLPIWAILGLGCAATRLLTGSHFTTDLVVSATIGYAIARTVWYYAHPPQSPTASPVSKNS
ncbi:phosphatase PAP2 family protein [Mucisphaera sp.]|uniref:phosphatase PAP2 family protein n=1 Tax=Mucisphaera sp. TaxID=2913024 RepID=UPI003D14F64B